MQECLARLRHAAESGQYGLVQELLRQCEEEVRQAAARGMPGDAREREAFESVEKTLLWARRVMRAARAHDAAALARCRAARPYHPPSERRPSSIHLDA
jgi:hypothetical protein